MPGPIPKRTEQRAGHRSKAELARKVARCDVVSQPEPDLDWHPKARRWYVSLAESGQADFYEPSDWELAAFLAQMMTHLLESSRPSSEMLKAILGGMQDLGVTEAARRRMRVEVDRPDPNADKVDAAKVTVMNKYRRAAKSA